MIRRKNIIIPLILKLLIFTILSDQVFSSDVSSSSKKNEEQKVEIKGSYRANLLAKDDDLDELIDLAHENRALLFVADENGWTPLHEAARQGHVLTIFFLVENGADALAKTSAGKIPRDLLFDPKLISEESEEDDDMDYLNDRYNCAKIILENAEKGLGLYGHRIEKEKLSKSKQIVVEFPNLSHALVHFNLRETLEELYLYDESILDDEDYNGWTPLHEAARYGNVDIISYLIRQGANLYSKTNEDLTPLDIALQFSEDVGSSVHVDLIRLEMERSAQEF